MYLKKPPVSRKATAKPLSAPPRVVSNTEESDRIYQEALEEAQKYDYFHRKYGHREQEKGRK